jgi:predicted nucleotidyltransferase
MGGLDVVDRRLRELWERADAVLSADSRVRRVELSGSIGAGTADEWSDLDIAVVTEPDHHEDFLAEWPRWLAEITPTVFARTPIAPFIINSVTTEGLTFDVAVWPGQAPPPFVPPPQYTVGMLGAVRYDDVADALAYAVEEQLRGMAGPFISLLQRGEHLRHLTGVPHLLSLLTTVFLAETGAPPPGKHWNRTFTEEQRDAVAALPPAAATRDDIVAFGMALAELLLTRARPLYERYGLTWPAELAAVARDRVREQTGIDISAWCH